MRFDGSTRGALFPRDLLSTRLYPCGHSGKSRSETIHQLDPGAARSMMTNNRVEARRRLRTRLRRALGVRRENVRTSHCRLLQRVALLLSWGQVQDGRGAPRRPRRRCGRKIAATSDTVSRRSSPCLRPAARGGRLRSPARAPSRCEPRCELPQAPPHTGAHRFPRGCAPRLQEVRDPPDVRILISNREVSVYLVYVLHCSSPFHRRPTIQADNSGVARRTCDRPRVAHQAGYEPKHRGKPSGDLLLQT